MHRPIRSRISLALPLLAATLFATLAAGCGDDTGGAPKVANVADHRVAYAAPTPTVPGVCAPKPSKPTTVEVTEGGATAPYPVKPGSCAK